MTMKVINLSEQPSLLNQYLKELRSVEIQKDSMRFRRNIERIGEIMAVEISRQLTYAQEQVQTPLAVAQMEVPQDQVVLGTVLRAGLPMHQGFLNMFDHAENAFVSAYRKETIGRRGETQLEIVSEYLAAPSIEGKTLILVDPMLATGLSMEVAYKALLSHGTPKHVHVACIFSTPQSIQYLSENMPENTTLWCAVTDPVLNEHKYIVPGLGDAGDLCFGEKL
jgi:uracil phosphoribosyltransferase